MVTYLFLDEAARIAKVSVSTLRRAIRRKELSAILKARRWRIVVEELERWQAKSEKSFVVNRAKARTRSVQTEPMSTEYLWDQP